MIEIELFKELEIQGDGLEDLRAELVASVHAPWSYLSDRVSDTNPSGKFVIFGYRDGNYPDANLWLAWADGKVTIGNIVPVEMQRLSKTQYNALLDDFYVKHMKLVVDRLHLKVSFSRADRDFAEWIGPEAMRRLKIFSGLAPKASINHPMDRERWMDFVIAVQKKCGTEPVPAESLERWLVDDGWPEVFAEELAAEYSNVMEWLERYAIAS